MPSKLKKSPSAKAIEKLPEIAEDLIAHFVKSPLTGEAVQLASAAFKEALIERALGAKLGHHWDIHLQASARPTRLTSATAAAARRC